MIKIVIIIIVVFITGLHKKPQGCGASVASAAGPFITKKKNATTTPTQEQSIKGLQHNNISK
jgi:hypothetical protein